MPLERKHESDVSGVPFQDIIPCDKKELRKHWSSKS